MGVKNRYLNLKTCNYIVNTKRKVVGLRPTTFSPLGFALFQAVPSTSRNPAAI